MVGPAHEKITMMQVEADASESLTGLFTPNAGQHFRDEQRRRRSQYDRGTRLAALEEGNDFGMYPHREPIR